MDKLRYRKVNLVGIYASGDIPKVVIWNRGRIRLFRYLNIMRVKELNNLKMCTASAKFYISRFFTVLSIFKKNTSRSKVVGSLLDYPSANSGHFRSKISSLSITGYVWSMKRGNLF